MSVSYLTKIVLAHRSGNRCAFKDCKKLLSSGVNEPNPTILGQAAHIYGEKEKAARYKKNMPDIERNSIDNLIYLCPNCHTKIDKQEDNYPAEILLKLKKTHEEWVFERLDQKMSEVAFAELEVAASAIAIGQHVASNDFTVIPPENKINKNGLTSKSYSFLSMGLSRGGEVSKFLTQMSQIDDGFAERLQSGFKNQYIELKQSSFDNLKMTHLGSKR